MEKTPRYFVVRRAPKRIEMMDEERTKDCTQDERDDQTNFQCRKIKVSLEPGIHRPPGPGTDRSELVKDFQIFVGPRFLIFSPLGPVRDQSVLVRGSLVKTITFRKIL